MTLGSLIGGFALVIMGSWAHPVAYIVCWIALGVSMATLLYEPAFAVITTAFGPHYKRGIILITLVAGLASSVFIPAAHYLVQAGGWQRAMVILGAIQLAVGVPLHYFGMPRGLRPENQHPARSSQLPILSRLLRWLESLQSELGDRRFIGLAFWFSTHAAAFSGLTFLLVPMNARLSFDTETLLTAIALIGPMQVTGRLVLAVYGNNISALHIGAGAMMALNAATVCLMIQPPTFVALIIFAILYGTGNGLMTIVKGTAVAELFGRQRYAELNGLLSAPAVLAKAGAPLALAALWAATDNPRVVIGTVAVILVTGMVGLLCARSA